MSTHPEESAPKAAETPRNTKCPFCAMLPTESRRFEPHKASVAVMLTNTRAINVCEFHARNLQKANETVWCELCRKWTDHAAATCTKRSPEKLKIRDLTAASAAKDARIAELEAKISRKNQCITEKNRELETQRTRIDALSREKEELEAKVSKMVCKFGESVCGGTCSKCIADAKRNERYEADRRAGIRRCIDCDAPVGECECN